MLYDGKYGDVEPGSFKDYVRRSIFLKRQQAEVMKHLALLHTTNKNVEKANSTLKTYMTLELPYLYDTMADIDEQKKAAAIMKEYEGKVIEFRKVPGTEDNNMSNPFELTSQESVIPAEGKKAQKPKDPLARNRKK